MNRIAAQDDGRERFPELEADIGEDPARFLGRDVDELVLARIRGIDRLDVLRAWRAIERRLAGRGAVLEALERREAYLETHGERDLEAIDVEAIREQRRTEAEPEPDPVWRHEPCGSIDVERESSRTWFCRECEQRTNRVEEVDPEDVDVNPEESFRENDVDDPEPEDIVRGEPATDGGGEA